MFAGFTRFNHKNAQRNQERAASVERESSSNEVEARMSVDWSIQENLFGEHQAQDLLSDKSFMNTQAELLEPNKDDFNVFEQDPRDDDDTGAEESVENQGQSRRTQL